MRIRIFRGLAGLLRTLTARYTLRGGQRATRTSTGGAHRYTAGLSPELKLRLAQREILSTRQAVVQASLLTPTAYLVPSGPPSTSPEARDPVASEIRGECERRGIGTVVHFTDTRNLAGIFRNGLLSVRKLVRRSVTYFPSNADRRNGWPDAICLSVEFPNWQMFYSKQQQEGRCWAVVGIESRILWELDCAFTPDNSARAVFRGSGPSRGTEGFRALFSDVEGRTRVDLGIPDCYPTHPQSEILCFERIPLEYLKFIHVDSRDLWRRLRHDAVDAPIPMSLEKRYFRPRSDWQHWSKSVTGSAPALVRGPHS